VVSGVLQRIGLCNVFPGLAFIIYFAIRGKKTNMPTDLYVKIILQIDNDYFLILLFRNFLSSQYVQFHLPGKHRLFEQKKMIHKNASNIIEPLF